MPLLDLFPDDILYICTIKDVFVHGKICSVKYSDKKKYAARVLAIRGEFADFSPCDVSWLCVNQQGVTYSKIYKKCLKNTDSDILYVEKSILPQTDLGNCINVFSLESVNEEDFFEKASHFFKFKMVPLNNEEASLSGSSLHPASMLQASCTVKETTSTDTVINPNETYTLNSTNAEISPDIVNVSEIEEEINELGDACNALTNTDYVPIDNTVTNYGESMSNYNILPDKFADLENLHSEMLIEENINCISYPFRYSNNELKVSVEEESLQENQLIERDTVKSKPKVIKTELVNLDVYSHLLGKDRVSTISQVPTAVTGDDSAAKSQSLEINNLSDISTGLPVMQSTMYEMAETDNKATTSEHFVDTDVEDKSYEPSDHESSDSYESFEQVNEPSIKKSNESGFSKSLNITIDMDKYKQSAPDDIELHVSDSETRHAKKHFCIYCKKLQSKLARHLETVHAEEEDVKKFMILPPKNKERQEVIATIRKNGDHIYNTDRRYNKGTLLVCRRPNVRLLKTAEDFLSCGNCKGQYARSVIRHHWRRCTNRDGKNERVVLVKGRKVAARIHERASKDVRRFIFPYMREDGVVRSIRYDELIILYANKQCQKYGTHQHQYQMIRARLRLLGRFLISIKKVEKRIMTFADIFQPRYYDAAIAAVRLVAEFNEEKKIFEHPVVASNLGTLLKHTGDLLRSEYIKKELEHEQKKVEDFLKLLAEDYGANINRVVVEIQTQNNRRKEVILPTTEDIKKLYSFLKAERTKYFSKLQHNYSFETWEKLAETTLLSLQVFNRRRPGEIERLYLDDFRSYRGIDNIANKDTYKSLSEEGKILARKYVRIEICGKLGRGVPVLIENDVLDCLNLIIYHRKNAGVPQHNEYLFGLPSSDKDRNRYLRACNLMREYSEKCGAEIPSTLRGTQLRKHIATKCINLNLTDGQVTDLANFMGHHEKIHKEIYRQPVLETDIVKISKILKTAQGFDVNSNGSDVSETEFSIEESRDNRSSGQNRTFTKIILETSTPKRWSNVERNAVLSVFGIALRNNKMPTGREMQELINSQDCLKDRTVPQLRSWLHTYKKKYTSSSG